MYLCVILYGKGPGTTVDTLGSVDMKIRAGLEDKRYDVIYMISVNKAIYYTEFHVLISPPFGNQPTEPRPSTTAQRRSKISLIYTASRDTLRRRPEQEGDKGSMNKTGATNDFFTSDP
ncbi:hypothetical protein Y1Q_0021056 [Alligator mississippiensis]|uniref:Uncharacterized protein n=1 Tax=Alligator mississippiensis TaxID=8496 RepID=A0A151NRI0_ALLMI|nr:hypothetical protein Y1Q_0021056 [Alligator mississippiensis]